MKNKNREIVYLAVMVALMLVLQLTGLGLIRLGIIDLTLYCVVVVVGTIMLGLKSGLVLGLSFGLLSFWSGITSPSALIMPIQTRSIPALLILCVLPRLMIPLLTHIAYTLLSRTRLHKSASASIAAVCGSLTNTVFFLGTMYLLFQILQVQNAELQAALGDSVVQNGLLAVLGGIVVQNGLLEAAAAGIVSAPIVTALQFVQKKK